MFMKEETLKTWLKTAAGILVTILTLILAGRWYVSTESAYKVVEGVAGIFLALVPTWAAILYFYKKKSRWHELAVEVMSIAIVLTLVLLIEPTTRDPGLAVGYKKLLIVSLYLVLVTFATQWVKPEMISDPREKYLLKGIHAVTGVLVGFVTLWLTVHWYVYNTKGIAAVIVTLLLTGLTVVFFIDEDSGDIQVGTELLTIVGVPALLMWAQPDPNIDPEFGLYKKLIPAVLYLVVVAFACMFIDERGLSAASETDMSGGTEPANEFDDILGDLDDGESSEEFEPQAEDFADSETEPGEPQLIDPAELEVRQKFQHQNGRTGTLERFEVLAAPSQMEDGRIKVKARNLRTGAEPWLIFSEGEMVEEAA